MATTAMFAPYEAAHAMARRVVVPATGNIYQLNAQGAALIDTADAAWFQAQGFSPTPTAGSGQTLIYAPYVPDQEFARRITAPSGNTYVFNAAGAAAVASADVGWFQSQGYALAPAPGTGQTAMYVSFEVGQATAGPIVSPITNKLYVVNGQGYVLVDTADVAWFQGQGFSPSVAGGVAPPVFPPLVGATQATIAADFAGSQYWASAASQANFAAWMTAIGGTYARSSSATYLQGGVVKTATANTPRFPTSLAAAAQGLRLTGAATNIQTQSADFSQAVWSAQSVTMTPGQPDPAGGTSATKLVPTALSASHGLADNLNPAFTATPWTISIFVKNAGYNFFAIDFNNFGAQLASIDLTTGAVATFGTVTAKSVQLANGWWLFSVSGVPGQTGNWPPAFYITNSAALPTTPFAGDTISGAYVWGVQITNTAFPVDYIPTTTASVTQAADALSFPFTQRIFSALVGSNSIAFDATAIQRILGDNNNAGIYIPAATQLSAHNGSVSLAGPTITDVSNAHKAMIAGNASNTWVTSDGLTPTTSAIAVNAAAPTTLGLGSQSGTANFAGGNFSQLAIWNALVASTAEMQRLTT